MDYESVIDWDADEQGLDRIAVSPLSTDVRNLVIARVDTILHSNERAPGSLLEPIVAEIRQQFFSPATFFALLASRFHFKHESQADAGNAKLWRTRWAVCEELALLLVAEYDSADIASYLVFEFYPLADGSPVESPPTYLRVSALELAIKSEAKRFLAHPVVVQLVSEVWDGHLVLDPLVHKLHRSEHLSNSQDLRRLLNARKGVVVSYDFETTTVFKPSRLRVPKYRDWLKLANLVILIGLYIALMGPKPPPAVEVLFQVWMVSFLLDELQVLAAVGAHLYFRTLWSLCDFAIAMLGGGYLVLTAGSYMAERPEVWRATAFDVLAVCGVVLIPRVFSVLEASVGFSRTVISVRRMITELIWCWVAITMFSVGFWAALAHFGKGTLSQTQVFYDLVQIMFGFTPAVWQTWQDYPAAGAMILFVYLFMAQFVVTTIVTAALSAKVVETRDNSLEEYHFLNAVKAEVRIKSERQVLYFYAQPFNIIAVLVLPVLRYVLATPLYLRLNRVVLKATHWHIFLAIYAYERLSSAIISRREKYAEAQQERLAREVQDQMAKSGGTLREEAQIMGRGSLRDTRFDLVEELLNQPAELTPSSSRQRPRRPPSLRLQRPFNSQSAAMPGVKAHRYSFSSEFEMEPVTDLSDTVRELQRSNARLEEMLARILQRLDGPRNEN